VPACAECGDELDVVDDVCSSCGKCDWCCACDDALFDADELGLDPEEDDERGYGA
jgi:hypothetical protein